MREARTPDLWGGRRATGAFIRRVPIVIKWFQEVEFLRIKICHSQSVAYFFSTSKNNCDHNSLMLLKSKFNTILNRYKI